MSLSAKESHLRLWGQESDVIRFAFSRGHFAGWRMPCRREKQKWGPSLSGLGEGLTWWGWGWERSGPWSWAGGNEKTMVTRAGPSLFILVACDRRNCTALFMEEKTGSARYWNSLKFTQPVISGVRIPACGLITAHCCPPPSTQSGHHTVRGRTLSHSSHAAGCKWRVEADNQHTPSTSVSWS